MAAITMAGEQQLGLTIPEIRRTGAGTALQIHHSHPELEFNFVLSGRGTIFLDDGQHDLRPGCLVWLLPNQPHRLMRSPDLDMWVGNIATADCDPRLLAGVAQFPARVLPREDAVEFDRLLAYISQDSDDPELYRSGLSYAFRSAHRLTLASPSTTRAPLHPAVLKALMLLRSCVEVPTAAALAKKCGVTQDYLSRLIAEQTGRGIVEWRNRFRLERFHICYPDSEDLLTAALAAGFGSYTQFHRVFVEMVGSTPGEWARSASQGKRVALPSASNVLPNLESGSSRMSWYALAEVPLPSAGKWVGAGFASAFLAQPADVGEGVAVPSLVSSFDSLHRFRGSLVIELESRDAEAAALLKRVLERNDIFRVYHGTIAGPWKLGSGDLSSLFGMYLAVASMIAHGRAPLPGEAELKHFVYRVRHAMRAAGSFTQADGAARSQAAAAVIAQTVFLRNAIYAARSSGSDKLVERVADAAHRTALLSVGIDLRAVDEARPAA